MVAILEYGTGLAANEVKRRWDEPIHKLSPAWFSDTLTKFDCVVVVQVKKKQRVEEEMKQVTKYLEFNALRMGGEVVAIHLFPKEEKPPTTASGAPKEPTLWDTAHTTSEKIRKGEGRGTWVLDELCKAAQSVVCVSQFSKDLLTLASAQFKQQLGAADLTTTFVPIVGGSWYVYTDYRLLKQTVKLDPDTKYYDPLKMNMPGAKVPKAPYTFVGIKYLEILAAAGMPDRALLSQLLEHPCDILNPGLHWPTRHWFMVACLAESTRHPEWHLLARIAIELYSQSLLPWKTLVCEELWAPQTHDSVNAMHFYKEHGEPRHDDWRYTQRCIALIVTWMMTKHQVEAPGTVFGKWLRANLATKLNQLAASIDKARWAHVPDLSTYPLQIAPPPQVPGGVPSKPKVGLELFKERIAQAQEEAMRKEKEAAAVLLQSAARGFLARMQLATLKSAQQTRNSPPLSHTNENPQ
ncbi:calmodulin-binding protein [Stigmatella sp. ncwal1]|uniref:Calmodulin-binding protein n=1 Tax=Stigmatella ashevillensis TaxID=2995309 RepID=A0ABT5DCS6_9BACT|nr:calmodulin-binding protein [Stigmatella ashevillena]MDC0711479.1 calmodulin-binding protein [Stigmatella ashevillena]